MSLIADDKLALQRLYHWESSAADKICMSQPMGGGITRDFTWRETMDEARRMAAYLMSFGWQPGTRIALMSKNCAHWLMADYAIWLAGYVSVPLYPTLTPDAIRQILDHSGAEACFIGKLDGWEAMAPGVPEAMPCIAFPLSPETGFPAWDDIIAATPPLQGHPTRPGSDLCTIVYTSGTTGMPKGVMLTFAALAWSLEALVKRIPITADDRIISYLPLSHVAERAAVEFGMLAKGYRAYFSESLDTFVRDIQAASPTLFFSVPRLWVRFQQGVSRKMPPRKLNLLLKLPLVNTVVKRKILAGLGLDQCRIAVGGAAPMPADLLNWYKRLGLEIIEAYGMSENCAISHSNIPGRTRPGFVGTPYDGVESRIDAETGEIQMRSPGLMSGYYKAPDLTAEALTPDGWLRTGDKGEVDAHGNLKITGRLKDLFKTSKGKYVAPGPIEERLIGHEGIEAVCIAGANCAQPFGLLMLSPEAMAASQTPAAREAMTRSLAAHLAKVNAGCEHHEQLACLVVVAEPWTVENGILTPTMKIKRNNIERQYERDAAVWSQGHEPVVWQAA